MLNWDLFMTLFVARFSNPLRLITTCENLDALQSSIPLTTLVTTFTALRLQLRNVTMEEYLMYKFIRIMKKNTRSNLVANLPANVDEAINRALALEYGHAFVHRNPQAMELVAMSHQPRSSTDQPRQPSAFPSKLTPEKYKECLKNKLCFRCRGKNHKASECPGPQVNSLEPGNEPAEATE
ncbi:hypothetical protein GQ42DRAFT_67997 [Ramicandelaber brevisporus]|nr:hypothetical protein GQ42DRAFT_67997 [Ramicandelaber brevisporus]